MIGSVSASRRANAFAQALDEQRLDEATAAGQAAGDGATEATPPGPGAEAGGGAEEQLLRLVDELGALPKPELDPEVKTVHRAQMIAAMESAFAHGAAGATDDRVPEQRTARPGKGSHRAAGFGPLSKLRPKSRIAKGLTAGGLGVGVAATALGGVAAASSDALPGDHLYGFKRGMEDLKLDLAGDEADRGRLYLDNASTRFNEARRLLETSRGGPLGHEALGEVRRTLSGMRHDAGEGHRLLSAAYERDGDLGPMQSLSSFSRSHRAGWAELRHRLPVQLNDVGDEVNSVFDAIDEEVGPLEDMFPKAPGSAEPRDTPRGGDEPRHEKPGDSPRPSSPDVSEGSDGRTGGDTSRSPSPSDSHSEKEGLLGGDGLLGDPSEDPGEEPSEPQSDSPSPDGGSEDGKVDLPPIVPKVLPGLDKLPPDPPKE